MLTHKSELYTHRWLTIAIASRQNVGMHPYELERLAAQRQADYVREAREAGGRGGRLGVAVARALREMADRLDGGRGDTKRLGTARALD